MKLSVQLAGVLYPRVYPPKRHSVNAFIPKMQVCTTHVHIYTKGVPINPSQPRSSISLCNPQLINQNPDPHPTTSNNTKLLPFFAVP